MGLKAPSTQNNKQTNKQTMNIKIFNLILPGQLRQFP